MRDHGWPEPTNPKRDWLVIVMSILILFGIAYFVFEAVAKNACGVS